MTRALARTRLPSSSLIRTLADLTVLAADEPRAAVAEKLGQWIDFGAAITLSAVHSASPTLSQAAATRVDSAARVLIAEEFARQRLGLENSIKAACSSTAAKSRMTLPVPQPGVSMKEASAYEPYRRHCSALQRDMELSTRSLRARLRERIAKASPRLRPLVELDAALDAILGERESKLLATLPSLLERRFAQLLKAHRHRLLAAEQEDAPALWMKPGAWLARFCDELQTVLLAELDLRLLPTLGLIEALNNENTKHT